MRGGPDSVPLIGVAGAVVAVACCAGLPLVATILGGLTLAAVVGVAGGVLLAAGALAGVAVVLCGRRNRECGATKRVTR
jgi:hypothetical protein